MSSVFAQTQEQWVWQTPIPQGNDLQADYFINAGTGYAVGFGGTILRTTDGGSTWTTRFLQKNIEFNCVQFWTGNTGIVHGLELAERGFGTPTSVSYRTQDGGSTWTAVNTSGILLKPKLQATGRQVGYVSELNGILHKTSDRGLHWKTIVLDTSATISSINLIGDDTAYVLMTHSGERTNTIYRTTDGGTKWDTTSLRLPWPYDCLQFLGKDTVFAAGVESTSVDGRFSKGLFRYSTDAGRTWTQGKLPDSLRGGIRSIHMFRSGIGYATSIYGLVLITSNGGADWTDISNLPAEINTPWTSPLEFSFPNDRVGYATGWMGRIFKTDNGGGTWVSQSTGTELNVSLGSVIFTSSKVGFAAGGSMAGTAEIIKTMNGGSHWDTLILGPDTKTLRSIHFQDQNSGFAVGDAGTILGTENGGADWEVRSDLSLSSKDLVSVQRISGDIGYAVSHTGEVLKSGDGGRSWKSIYAASQRTFSAVCFLDANTGFVVGSAAFQDQDSIQGFVLKTSDGGSTWMSRALRWEPGKEGLQAVSFPSRTVGYILGNLGSVFKTSDGGESWNRLPGSPPLGSVRNFLAIHFLDPDTGYVAGNGEIFRTVNGGKDWEPQNVPMYAIVNGMHFPDRSTGYAVGGADGVLKLNRNPASLIVARDLPKELFSLGRDGEIRYSLPARTRVSLQLFCLSGSRIQSILDEVQEAGPHSARLPRNFAPPGAYIMDFRTGWMHRAVRVLREPVYR